MKIRTIAAGMMAAVMTAAMSTTGFAAELNTDFDDDGFTTYYDDGTAYRYNLRTGSELYFNEDGDYLEFDRRGNVTMYDSMWDETTYIDNSSSRSSSSSRSYRYEDACVTDAYWDYSNGKCVARWDASHRSAGDYTITLYRDGHKVTSKTSSGGSSVSFTDAIANCGKTGDYTFTVKGKWSGGYSDSADSDTLYIGSDRMSGISGRYSGSSTASNPGSGPASSTGWQWTGNSWKYKRANGTYAANCWEQVNGKWYNFDGSGIRRANQWVRNTNNEHVWYYVGNDGAMVTNTSINGYSINANGECIC